MSAAKNILLVDDESEILNTYVHILTEAGYKTVTSKDGVDALFRMQNDEFDLVITDLKMPRLSGDKMIMSLLAKDINEKCQIIISSGFVDHKILEQFKDQKRVHFLPKPTQSKELIAKIAKLLGQQKPSSIDVRVINPIIGGALQVVSPAFEGPLKAGKPSLRQEKEVSGDISVIVGLVSPGFKGNIALSFIDTNYFRVVAKKFGTELKEIDEDARDTIGEIIRTIFEHAKEIFVKDTLVVQMTSPLILTGKGHSVSHHSKQPPMVILFENEKKEGFRIEISSIGN